MKQINFPATGVRNSQPSLKDGMGSKVVIMIVTVLICTILFGFHFNKQKKEILHFNVVVGNLWSKEPLKADFTFPIYKDEAVYRKERSDARKSALPVFLFNDEQEKSSNDLLTNIFKYLKQGDEASLQGARSFASETTVKDFFKNNDADIQKNLKDLEKVLRNFLNQIYRYGLADRDLTSLTNTEICIRYDINSEKILQKSFLKDVRTIREKAKEIIEESTPPSLQKLTDEILTLIVKPNLIYSPDLTEKARELAELSVGRTEGIVKEGELIVDKGQRVTDEIISKLSSYQHSKFLKNDSDNSSFLNYLGSFGHAGFIYAILIIYLVILRKKILFDNMQFGVLNFLLVLVAIVSWASIQIPSKYPIEYLIIVPGISMLVAIIFDSRTAFYFTVTISLLVAGIRGNDYDTGTAMMFAGILGAYTVRDIQSRTQIFKSIFFITLGFIITIISFGFERSISFDQTSWKIVISFFNAAFSPIITFGLLFIIERFTSISSDLRLEEYNKLSHPLLVKMNEIAPGTYQHTLQMAVLAEKCASAIDANKLLARVGALYHDIGKITKPEYFVENQLEMENKHDLISPRKSAETIKKHVTDGLKLAREYKLPQKITDFIPMHHGTYLIKHFYAKALEESKGEPINEMDYRYPGPKPSSKESAIIMICDSAEAISRVAANDKEELEKAIDRSINLKLQDGQFDECDITLRELHIIRDVCLRSLYGIAHQRVEYKELPGENENNNSGK